MRRSHTNSCVRNKSAAEGLCMMGNKTLVLNSYEVGPQTAVSGCFLIFLRITFFCTNEDYVRVIRSFIK